MKTRTRSLMTVVVALFLGGWAMGADPTATIITIPDMDCASCAKKLGTKVAEVPGVAKVEYNVPARTLTITPKAATALSPKTLWEVVEKGEKTPTKLEGPAGVFTSKPK